MVMLSPVPSAIWPVEYQWASFQLSRYSASFGPGTLEITKLPRRPKLPPLRCIALLISETPHGGTTCITELMSAPASLTSLMCSFISTFASWLAGSRWSGSAMSLRNQQKSWVAKLPQPSLPGGLSPANGVAQISGWASGSQSRSISSRRIAPATQLLNTSLMVTLSALLTVTKRSSGTLSQTKVRPALRATLIGVWCICPADGWGGKPADLRFRSSVYLCHRPVATLGMLPIETSGQSRKARPSRAGHDGRGGGL